MNKTEYVAIAVIASNIFGLALLVYCWNFGIHLDLNTLILDIDRIVRSTFID
jgi:hypothetical protein